MQKTCLCCNAPIIGRSDKKFCDDSCRNTYNNRLRKDATNLMRNVNNTLRKNRKILEEITPEATGKTKVNRKKLTDVGFDFNYITSTYTTQNGNHYRFVYEYGYLELENNWLAVVRRGD